MTNGVSSCLRATMSGAVTRRVNAAISLSSTVQGTVGSRRRHQRTGDRPVSHRPIPEVRKNYGAVRISTASASPLLTIDEPSMGTVPRKYPPATGLPDETATLVRLVEVPEFTAPLYCRAQRPVPAELNFAM